MKQKIIDTYYRILHLIRLFGAYTLQFIGRIKPIDSKTILFYAFRRKGLCCNPKYIMEELIRCYPGEYNLYWISEWPKTVETGDGYTVIRLRSIGFYLLCGYAKFIITNDRLDETMIKRKGQVYINTWHGGGLFKKAGYDAVGNEITEKMIRSFYSNNDYIIASSKKLEVIFQRAFRLDDYRVLPFGMPRSDVFYQKGVVKKVREKLEIPSDINTVLYAPTCRLNTGNASYFPESEIEILLNALHRRFGGKWMFLFKMHYFAESVLYKEIPEKVMCCNDYYDTQELLCGMDVLITDYSSLLWDYSLLDRPAFRYAPDLEIYIDKERDFYLEYDKWPFSYACNTKALYRQIEKFDLEEYRKNLEEFRIIIGNFDKGKSAQAFVQWLSREETF